MYEDNIRMMNALSDRYPFIYDMYITRYKHQILYIVIKESSEVLFKLQQFDYKQSDIFGYARKLMREFGIEAEICLKVIT